MRILSLNVNDFGGRSFFVEEIKKVYGYSWMSKWDAIQSLFNVDGLVDFITEVDSDILILQEFDLNSKITRQFTQKMEELKYHLIKSETSFKRPSMTVMFSKIEYPLVESPHHKTKRTARSVQIESSEVLVLGTHIPYDNGFWDEIIEYYGKRCDNSSLVLIGDFNIWLEKTNNDLSKFNSLMQLGAIDLGKKENKATRNQKRIDFALVTPEMEMTSVLYTTPCVINTKKFESIVERNLSDHEALILDII